MSKEKLGKCAVCGGTPDQTVHKVELYRRVPGGYGHPFTPGREQPQEPSLVCGCTGKCIGHSVSDPWAGASSEGGEKPPAVRVGKNATGANACMTNAISEIAEPTTPAPGAPTCRGCGKTEAQHSPEEEGKL